MQCALGAQYGGTRFDYVNEFRASLDPLGETASDTLARGVRGCESRLTLMPSLASIERETSRSTFTATRRQAGSRRSPIQPSNYLPEDKMNLLEAHGLAQTTSQQTWLWIGAIGMALGAIAIGFLGRTLGKHSHHAVASFFVCAIAACLYLLMAYGQGVAVLTKHSLVPLQQFGASTVVPTFAHARLEYFGRYIDWAFTTPLLLLGLIGIGMKASGNAEQARTRGGILGAAIGADVLMIVTGLFGALSVSSAHKYAWFAISCVFFVVVLGLIWGPVRAAAARQGAEVGALYKRLLGILTLLWFVYPVVWILGSEGTASISLNAEVTIFAIVDLTAKVGFGLALVLGVKRYSQVPARAMARAVA